MLFQLSEEPGYVLYSALGSFYIPSCIMVFVYINIYFAARSGVRPHQFPVPELRFFLFQSPGTTSHQTQEQHPEEGGEERVMMFAVINTGDISELLHGTN